MMKPNKRTAITLLCVAAALFIAGCRDSNVEKGAACLQLGDYVMAQNFFAKALARDPRNYDARVGMGKALLQRAVDNRNDTVSWREACRHLAAARTLRPSTSLNGLLSQVWSERSRVLIDHGDTLSALQALIHAIEYDPQRVEPLNTAGIIYFRMGEVEKSKTLLSKALSLDSTNITVLFNYGMVRWYAGDLAGAHDLWLKTLKRTPQDKTVLYWFALAEIKLREQGAEKQPTTPQRGKP
jgi:Flp pilus assembly protein TadD